LMYVAVAQFVIVQQRVVGLARRTGLEAVLTPRFTGRNSRGTFSTIIVETTAARVAPFVEGAGIVPESVTDGDPALASLVNRVAEEDKEIQVFWGWKEARQRVGPP